MKMKENNTSNIQKSIWIELWDCIKNGKSRLDYPNFPFSTFHFQLISGSNRHRNRSGRDPVPRLIEPDHCGRHQRPHMPLLWRLRRDRTWHDAGRRPRDEGGAGGIFWHCGTLQRFCGHRIQRCTGDSPLLHEDKGCTRVKDVSRTGGEKPMNPTAVDPKTTTRASAYEL